MGCELLGLADAVGCESRVGGNEGWGADGGGGEAGCGGGVPGGTILGVGCELWGDMGRGGSGTYAVADYVDGLKGH